MIIKKIPTAAAINSAMATDTQIPSMFQISGINRTAPSPKTNDRSTLMTAEISPLSNAVKRAELKTTVPINK